MTKVTGFEIKIICGFLTSDLMRTKQSFNESVCLKLNFVKVG